MKQVIHTDRAPKAIGPYSQGIVVGDLLFTAGQVGLNPSTGELATSVEDQVIQIMENLRGIAEQAGTSLENAVKTTIFLADLSHYAIVNEVYGRYFAVTPPVRSTVEVSKLPINALVEIEAIFLIP
ncbi:MAG: RidA family protein [Candidatus Heimdallarchaeota archaeon]|nr:RidA family protein [Candidatus Heimdallarchaeota archaeon]MDH5645028.1 RidA family protein [Candidatus Heimdallarchaeota archaeon]